jgi:hypothetical protein
MLALSLEREGRAEEWTWRDGRIYGPRQIDTSGLDCRDGMGPRALTLARLPALLDDSSRRVAEGDPVARLVVGQQPCGTALVSVHFHAGARVIYQGDGHFQGVE